MEILTKKPELEALARKILRGLATDEDLRVANVEDVRAIKSDTGERHFRTSAKPIEREAGAPARTKKYIASDETRDRMGDIIRVNGWDLTTFKENPQALWAHQAGGFPIGSVTDMRKATRDGKKALVETITYLAEGTSPTADILWKLIDQGVIRAVSVGFLPVKVHWPASKEERDQLGLGEWGCLYEKQEQLELSNCTIPANPNALATKSVEDALRDMVQRGEISERDAESVVELGSKRTVQVQVPELPEQDTKADEPPTEPETVSTNEWLFKINDKGCLQVVKPDLVLADEDAAEEAKDSADEVVSIDVGEQLEQIRSEIRSLAEAVNSILPTIEEVVGRSLRDPKRDLRTAVERAIKRVGQFPQGSN